MYKIEYYLVLSRYYLAQHCLTGLLTNSSSAETKNITLGINTCTMKLNKTMNGKQALQKYRRRVAWYNSSWQFHTVTEHAEVLVFCTSNHHNFMYFFNTLALKQIMPLEYCFPISLFLLALANILTNLVISPKSTPTTQEKNYLLWNFSRHVDDDYLCKLCLNSSCREYIIVSKISKQNRIQND